MKTCPQCGYTESLSSTDARVKVPHDDYGEIERLYTEDGLTMAEIGDHYGVTRERIRQILPQAASVVRSNRRKHAARTGRFLAACQRALDENLICRTCGGWILRFNINTPPPMNCSPDCSRDYAILFTFDNHENHRRQVARTYLASPEKYKASVLEWSEAMLGPNPPPPNRRYLVPGSKRAKVIAKYRPEQYAALIGGSGESD